MPEEQQSQSQQAATSAPEAQPSQTSTTQSTQGGDTLDAVYREFNVDQMAANFRPQPAQHQPAPQHQAAPVAPVAAPPLGDNVPDPVLDPAGFKSWQSQQVQALRQGFQQVQGMVNQMTQATQRQQEEADIKNAVQSVKQAGFEADDDFIEIALGQKARTDQRFLTIYNNRRNNPAAWNRALGAFANEAKGKYAFRADATLTENVRAAKASTQTTQAQQTTSEPAGDERRFAGKTGTAFDREWQSYVNRGM